jgi:hypothetical protein
LNNIKIKKTGPGDGAHGRPTGHFVRGFAQSRRGRRKRKRKAEEADGTTARNIQAASTTIERGSRKRTPGLCRNAPITGRKARILFRSNTITNSRPTRTRGINSRALVRHAHSGNARRISHGQGSGSHEELPERSAGGNKHGGHDGAEIRGEEEEEDIHDGEKELF